MASTEGLSTALYYPLAGISAIPDGTRNNEILLFI
jgi:hypothetical protein